MDGPKPGDVLADALELPPEEREAFVRQACGDDPALRAEVVSLLDAHERAGGLLPSDWLIHAAPLLTEHPDFTNVSPERELGRRIGDYTLRRVLGAGGMGAVYLADRADAEFVKQVAVKLVRPGMGTEEVLRRFWTERQVLANLEHPNIARLLDGGATEDGLPYLVMEFVDGAPIDTAADALRLPVAQRLRLFLQVCEAVAFAHQKLVVHRDIKPGNILVGPQGDPKLLDFGIAKILDPAESGPAAAVTRTGMRLLTPEYASPEQVRGEPVTTATDVYSLGVLLYELLTGRRPYAIRSRNPAEVERAICGTEPARPSTTVMEAPNGNRIERGGRDAAALAGARGTQPDRLRRQLAGDLDNIVMMALRKEPERRYPSVESLAGDIRRHLDGLPVAARKDTWRYRGSKFARRNRLAVGAGASIFLLLALFSVAMVFQAGRLARERDHARRETESSRRIATFLTDLFKVSQPEQSRGNDVTARELLEAGTQKIQEGLEEDPAVRAELLRTMGNTYESLGLHAPACSLLVSALEIQTALYGPADAEHLPATLGDLAIAYRTIGKHDESRALYARAFANLEAAGPSEDLLRAQLHNNFGALLFELGDYPGTREQLEKAIAIWERAIGPDCGELASPLRSLAQVALQDRKFDEAQRYAERGLQISEAHWGWEHPETIRSATDLGVVLGSAGKDSAAIVVLEKALPVSERIFGPTHERTGSVVNTLAGAYEHLGNGEKARTLYKRSLAIRQTTLGPRHASVANPMYRLAAIEVAAGDREAADSLFRECASILEESLGPDHPNLPYTLVQHGYLMIGWDKYQSAESLLTRADRIWEKNFGRNHPRMIPALIAEGNLERTRRDFPRSEAFFTRAMKISSDSLPPDHVDAAKVRKFYAVLLREMGEDARAAALEQPVAVAGGAAPPPP